MQFTVKYRKCDFAPDNRCDQEGRCESCSNARDNIAWHYELGYDVEKEEYIIFVDAFASNKNMLTVGDIAEDLGMAKRSVRKYFAEGRLDGYKLGGKWFVSREKYRKFKESRERKQ